MEDKTVYMSAYNEIFINTEATVFDRNRLYGAIGYKFNSKLRMEIGYMNQIFSNSSRDQVNVLFLVSFD